MNPNPSKMKASEVQALLEKITALNTLKDEWLDSVPRDINQAFFDNEYVNAYGLQFDALLSFVFKDWYEDACYFLSEQAPHEITTKLGEYSINTVEEYVDYMVAEEFVEDDR